MDGKSDLGCLSTSESPNVNEFEKAVAELAETKSHDAVYFSKQEKEALELHDHLEDLALEIALHQSVESLPAEESSVPDSNTAEKIKRAEQELLEARAAYLLKDRIVEAVLVTDPTLKAVHSGANATPPERRLHPLIDQRDLLSMANANLTNSLTASTNALTSTKAQSMITRRKNQELALEMLELKERLNTQEVGDAGNRNLLVQLKNLKSETRMSRTKWRMMKSVTAAVVVESGIDWARRSDLRDLVLDGGD